MRRLFVLLLIGVLALAVAVSRRAPTSQTTPRLDVAEALAAPLDGFERAFAPRPFTFPRDHGAHPTFQTEWWYYTGNLFAENGDRFGFQLTFFRRALSPEPPATGSAWHTNQIYFAHFALTDRERERFQAEERWARGAVGLAGADAPPYRVWLDDWRVEAIAEDADQVRLFATHADGTTLDLVAEAQKPLVLHGEAGWSPKDDAPGNASYYYSFTRMQAEGRIVRPDASAVAVRGTAWMDHEFSTSALGEDQVGWDWFSIQLDDGWELMYFQLRRADGTVDTVSGGTLIAPDGTTTMLARDDVQLEVEATWESPRTGALYPAAWRLRVPAQALDVRITPVLNDQELDVSVQYWEGAVDVRGTHGGTPVQGVGYVELTGYAQSMRGRF
ncbi:lipocalin-like domain-containing protein [Ardenticatena maritima]|nr:lipocalin-like domain-containing protein [Ardenticatena maritima]